MAVTTYQQNKINQKTLSFNLADIALWQLNSHESIIDLPPLQRGFVWKVNQIEAIWDSLLRGFPVGAFLLSKSEDGKLFLMDGQQRATSIAIGYYNPWELSVAGFWSLKDKVPVIWMDLAPKEKTSTHKFVLRVVTQSHPWGYQRVNHNNKLSVSDRKNALEIFKKNPENNKIGYINLPKKNVFPYDADLPVPLSFLIQSISECDECTENDSTWKKKLIALCEKNLSFDYIKTKNNKGDDFNYIESLKALLDSDEFDSNIFHAIKNIRDVEIPGIIVKKEILKAEDEQKGEDPTLFVRLNSSGTTIAGEELIYSIYKASFPEAKGLVEDIGASFVAPSLVISLVSRLAYAELKKTYPNPISVNEFRKRIQDDEFKNKVTEYIGDSATNQERPGKAKRIFDCAFMILLSENEVNIPPVLVKSIVRSSPELFLMLLQWINIKDCNIAESEKKQALASITALCWFGRDNTKYVRELWGKIVSEKFWCRETLSAPYSGRNDYLMYPLIRPSTLREFLMDEVVIKDTHWYLLYPSEENNISKLYRNILTNDIEQPYEAIRSIWNNFINKVFSNKSLLIFAQRKYINDSFGDFNQMEDLDDTNTPWDWDHIYPASWVYAKRYIHHNTRHWTHAIGNFRAISLEENRSQNNSYSPKERLADVREQSFIDDNDWFFWEKIDRRINEGDDEMIKFHLSAIVTRLCSIYEEWYNTLQIGELFDFETEASVEKELVEA